MERSLVRISSLFLLVILTNHIVLATNARVISSTSSVDELAACPPTDEISTSESNPVDLNNSQDLSKNTDEIAACPPTDEISTTLIAGGPSSDFPRVQTTSVSDTVDPNNVHDSGKITDEIAACPPTEN